MNHQLLSFISSLLCALLLCLCGVLTAQNCQVNGLINIKSEGTTEITFDVSGLDDSDLSGLQSLCLVELEFSHNSVSTLEVSIISPAGQSVLLIGPANESSLGSTQFIDWDVRFVAPSFPAIPDDNFDDVWNSSNAWETFENYDGRYYPSQGDLNDMNSGSANGIWTLQIQDLSQEGSGKIKYARISFCDTSGQICNSCYADAGNFDQVSTQVFCTNDPLLSNDSYFMVSDNAASFNNDSYNFAIANGDAIVSFDDEPNLASLDAGAYTLCGIINDGSNQADLELISSLSSLRGVFSDGSYCGAVMQDCLEIIIEDPQASETIEETICKDEVLTINGLNFHQAIDTTVYSYISGNCEKETRYIINQINVESRIDASSNIIGCNETLILNGDASIGSGYRWTSDSGSFENANNGPMVMINQPGLYFLEVSSGDCTDISSIEILPGSGFTNTINLSAGVLDCNNPEVTINASITGDYDSFTWSGPDISDPNELNPSVIMPGVYTLTVNNSSSPCETVSNSIEITQSNSATIPLFNNLPLLECNGFVQLQVVNTINATEAAWTNENGDTLSTNLIAFNVPGPGEYTFSYTDQFGCEASASTIVEANYDPLEYTITIDSLTCGDWDGQIFLDVTSGSIESYFWIGPATTFFFDEDPEIELPGNYQLIMTGSNGCVTRDAVVIDYDAAAFNFDLSVPKITCAEPEVELQAFGPETWEYEWGRPNDFSFSAPDSPTIIVDEGGSYFVTITRPSDGCEVREWTFVQTDTIPADFTFDIEKLDCDTDAIKIKSNANGFDIQEFTWQGPGITADNENELFPQINMIGEYVITGISGNGCEFQNSVFVEEDFSEILLTLESETQPLILDCADPQTVFIQSTRTGEFSWTTPSGTMFGPIIDNRLILDIEEGGTYVIDIFAPDNGCSDQLLIDVQFDLSSVTEFYPDQDGDGFGVFALGVSACSPPPGFVTNTTDCDDNNPDVYPGAPQGSVSGFDYNCDGTILIIDIDQDGFDNSVDCDDENPDINPGAIEIPDNLIDDNCDGVLECTDLDQDGFCINEDCDDTNAAINPDAEEIPGNDIDENCDGGPDVFGVDMDADGYEDDVDCDDNDSDINPGATEIPDNDIDENCDGVVECTDLDNDGFCIDEDCDDTNPNIYPGAPEIPDNDVVEDCDLLGVDAVVNLGDIEVNIFPNPAPDFIYIESTTELDLQYEFYTVAGSLVMLTANRGKEAKIDISKFEQGLYFLIIKNMKDKSKSAYRFMKM